MPMQSRAERAYLWIHHPEIAREFEGATPANKQLPKRKKKRKHGSLAAALAAREGNDK
jgi:hypothetical protein